MSQEIKAYFDATAYRDTRENLKQSVRLVDRPGIAIDCGCGAGSDIAFLRSKGFTVHAFDIEYDAIERCRKRFSGDDKVILSHDSFSTFRYPCASLILADASLFFCPENQFAYVWDKIANALAPKGIFTESFLGPEDTMARPDYDRSTFWTDILVTTEAGIRKLLSDFEIISFREYKKSGETANGSAHHWHVFSVVARRKTSRAAPTMAAT